MEGRHWHKQRGEVGRHCHAPREPGADSLPEVSSIRPPIHRQAPMCPARPRRAAGALTWLMGERKAIHTCRCNTLQPAPLTSHKHEFSVTPDLCPILNLALCDFNNHCSLSAHLALCEGLTQFITKHVVIQASTGSNTKSDSSRLSFHSIPITR